jgi:hypothetical protein
VVREFMALPDMDQATDQDADPEALDPVRADREGQADPAVSVG